MAGELNKFGANIEATVAQQRLEKQRQAEANAERRRAWAEQRKHERAEKEALLLRKQNHVGTEPEVAFGKGANILCAQFLEYMEQMNFAGAVTLKDRAKSSPLGKFFGRYVSGVVRPYTVRAYPIARTMSQETRNVFLCEDGMIRHRRDDGSLQELMLGSAGRPGDRVTTSYIKREQVFLGMSECNRAGATQPVFKTETTAVNQTLEEVLTGIALEQRAQQTDGRRATR